jgi:hypothetical protein
MKKSGKYINTLVCKKTLIFTCFLHQERVELLFFFPKFVRYLLLCWLQATKCLLNSCIGWIWKQVNHEDFNEGIIQVQAKKKASLNYYA